MGSYIIYKCTLPDGKMYIGQTNRSLDERIKEHFRDAMNPKCRKYNIEFYKKIREFGPINVKFEIIDHADSQDELNQKEKYWLAYYNTDIHSPNSNGYNMSEGGEGWSKYRK